MITFYYQQNVITLDFYVNNKKIVVIFDECSFSLTVVIWTFFHNFEIITDSINRIKI